MCFKGDTPHKQTEHKINIILQGEYVISKKKSKNRIKQKLFAANSRPILTTYNKLSLDKLFKKKKK